MVELNSVVCLCVCGGGGGVGGGGGGGGGGGEGGLFVCLFVLFCFYVCLFFFGLFVCWFVFLVFFCFVLFCFVFVFVLFCFFWGGGCHKYDQTDLCCNVRKQSSSVISSSRLQNIMSAPRVYYHSGFKTNLSINV